MLIEDQTAIVEDYHGEGSSNYEDLGYRFDYSIIKRIRHIDIMNKIKR